MFLRSYGYDCVDCPLGCGYGAYRTLRSWLSKNCVTKVSDLAVLKPKVRMTPEMRAWIRSTIMVKATPSTMSLSVLNCFKWRAFSSGCTRRQRAPESYSVIITSTCRLRDIPSPQWLKKDREPMCQMNWYRSFAFCWVVSLNCAYAVDWLRRGFREASVSKKKKASRSWCPFFMDAKNQSAVNLMGCHEKSEKLEWVYLSVLGDLILLTNVHLCKSASFPFIFFFFGRKRLRCYWVDNQCFSKHRFTIWNDRLFSIFGANWLSGEREQKNWLENEELCAKMQSLSMVFCISCTPHKIVWRIEMFGQPDKKHIISLSFLFLWQGQISTFPVRLKLKPETSSKKKKKNSSI